MLHIIANRKTINWSYVFSFYKHPYEPYSFFQTELFQLIKRLTVPVTVESVEAHLPYQSCLLSFLSEIFCCYYGIEWDSIVGSVMLLGLTVKRIGEWILSALHLNICAGFRETTEQCFISRYARKFVFNCLLLCILLFIYRSTDYLIAVFTHQIIISELIFNNR